MTNTRISWLSTAVLLIGQACAWGYPSGIELTSEQHHVWGYAGSDTMFGPGGTKVPYDQISSAPLYVSVTGTYMDPSRGEVPLTAWSSAGNFSTEAFAAYHFSRAYGESTYVFRPEADVRALTFVVSSSGNGVGLSDESHIGFTLDDLTTGASLASLLAPSAADWQDGSWSDDWVKTYETDRTHTYAMTLFTAAEGGDGTRHAVLTVGVLPIVPAPGALPLAVIGIACLSRRRRSPLR